MNPLNYASLEASKRLVEAGIVLETEAVLASYQSKDESGGINYGLYIQHKESLFRKRNSVG